MAEQMHRGERRAWWHSSTRRHDRHSPVLPIVLAGTLAFAASVTGAVDPVEAAPLKRTPTPRPALTDRGKTVREAIVDARIAMAATAASAAAIVRAAVAPPATYTVVSGDTVSDIAAAFGLSTPTVLALNGLGWSSVIHPGQVLKLTASGPVTAAPAPTPVAPELVKHTIAAGDTVSGIAAAHGVSTEAVLAANGLGWSSLIFPGQTLVIPSAGAPAETEAAPAPAPEPPAIEPAAIEEAAVEPAAVSEATAALDESMIANARVIIAVGRELGVSEYGIVIALATAAQESTMRNLDWGDRDSVGLFQQRPSTGWGSVEQLTDPAHATRLFFGGPSGPNNGTRGLLDIDGWESMPLTVAAQAVQISAYPDEYAKWEPSARAWLADLG
jgi:LysM repeat protein